LPNLLTLGSEAALILLDKSKINRDRGHARLLRAVSGPIESNRGSSLFVLPHFLRRTGSHFARKML